VQVEVLNSFTEVTLPIEHVKEILKGKAFGLDDATESIKIGRKIRNNVIITKGEKHPFATKI